MDCKFCKEVDQKLLVKEYTYWRIELNKNQYYLGRCKIVLKNHKEDLFDVTDEERNELFIIGKNLREALKKAFNANMINYTSMGNMVPHLHLHVIPRYKKDVVFENITFIDERWGQNYSPYNKDFSIPDDLLLLIGEKIKDNL